MKFIQMSIGNLVTRCVTWNPSRDGDGEFDYIDLGSVDKYTKRIEEVERHSCADAPSRARQLVKANDVLVATVRPNLNGVALVGDSQNGMTASTGYCVLRPIPEKLDSKFLFHWVKTGIFIQKMIDVATGANYPAVSDAKVKSSTILLPSLNDQNRIAGILDAADALRAKRRESLAQLDALLQSTFIDMFGDPVTNPMGWEIKPLLEIAELENGDRSRKYPSGNDLVDNGILFLSTKNIYDRYLILDNCQFITKEKFDSLSRGRLQKGDIAITLRGTLGSCAVFDCKYETGFINAQLMIIRPREVETLYLHSSLSSQQMHENFTRIATGVAVKQLTSKQIGALEIPLPPLGLQRRFAAIVESIEQQKAHVRAHLAELDALFASLQSRAFNGEL